MKSKEFVIIAHNPLTYNYVSVDKRKVKEKLSKYNVEQLKLFLSSLAADIEYYEKFGDNVGQEILKKKYGDLKGYNIFIRQIKEGAKILREMIDRGKNDK